MRGKKAKQKHYMPPSQVDAMKQSLYAVAVQESPNAIDFSLPVSTSPERVRPLSEAEAGEVMMKPSGRTWVEVSEDSADESRGPSRTASGAASSTPGAQASR